MRALQLTTLITTAVVLMCVGAWALWHTWVEQELPAEAADAVRSFTVRLDAQGRVEFQNHLLDLRFEEPGVPGATLDALEAALRETLGVGGRLRDTDDGARIPVVVLASPDAPPRHLATLLRAFLKLGITRVTVEAP